MKFLIQSKFQHWNLGMDEQFYNTLHKACYFLSMLRLKLVHVNNRGPSSSLVNFIYQIHFSYPTVHCTFKKHSCPVNILSQGYFWNVAKVSEWYFIHKQWKVGTNSYLETLLIIVWMPILGSSFGNMIFWSGYELFTLPFMTLAGQVTLLV